MADLISADEVADVRGVMIDIHDSFSVPMTVIKMVKKTISTPVAGYNSLYSRVNTTIVEEEQSFTVNVRKKFIANAGDDEYATDIQNRFPDAALRIKILAADKSTVDGARSIIFQGQRYELSGQSIPISIFGNIDYYIYYLKNVI